MDNQTKTAEEILGTTDALDAMLGITPAQASTLTPQQAQTEIDTLAESLIDARAKRDALDALIQKIEDAIWTRTPDEVGEVAIDGAQYTFTVSRGETWKWDSDKIGSKIVTSPLPECVKVKYSIDKKKYKNMSASEQSDWIDALEIKTASPKVSVVKKG